MNLSDLIEAYCDARDRLAFELAKSTPSMGAVEDEENVVAYCKRAIDDWRPT